MVKCSRRTWHEYQYAVKLARSIMDGMSIASDNIDIDKTIVCVVNHVVHRMCCTVLLFINSKEYAAFSSSYNYFLIRRRIDSFNRRTVWYVKTRTELRLP